MNSVSPVDSRLPMISGNLDVLREEMRKRYIGEGDPSQGDPGRVESLYVSLGGKYTEFALTFPKPSHLSSRSFPTNATYQMIPSFLRYPNRPVDKPARHVILLLDDFETEELREINRHLLTDLLSKFPLIEVVLYDRKLLLSDVRPLAEWFVEFARDLRISPHRCMICNFIRFRGCPSIDLSQFETDLPRIFQEVLDDSPYTDVLYQWFGHQFMLYHLVYSYKHYDRTNHLSVLRLLNECGNSTHLTSGNVANLFMVEHAQYTQNKRILREFLENTVDLLSYPFHSSYLCSPLVAFCPAHIFGSPVDTPRVASGETFPGVRLSAPLRGAY